MFVSSVGPSEGLYTQKYESMGDVLPRVWARETADSLEFMEEGFVEGGDTADIAKRKSRSREVELDSKLEAVGNVVTYTRSCDRRNISRVAVSRLFLSPHAN